jgi:DNA-binding NarL/FixJ family response regulator
MSKTSVVLADDHAIVRQGLRAVLEATSEFAVVGEVADGLQVSEVVDRLRPHVLVLDLMMPGLNGLEITRQVRKRCPQTRIVILSMHADEPYVLEALRNGAAGYVLKEASITDVAQAAPLDLYETLTTREREVLQLSAEGYSSTDMAARLGISPRTADTHRANLMRKLGLQGQTDLVRYALRRGILPL